MKLIKTISFVTISLSSAFVANSAIAGYSWTYTGSGETCPIGGCVESDTFAGKTVTSTATGWYSETTSGASMQEANKLRVWDGLSVEATTADTGTPNHATDNNGWYDSVLFDFGGDSVELDQVVMGWHQDTDFSLLRYTGNDTPALTGNSYSDLTATEGWELVSNYFCSCSNSSSGSDISFNVNADNKSSSYWLVAAINPAYFGNNNYIGNDYFKIKTLAGSYVEPTVPPTAVSAPATGFLLLLGGMFLYSNARKREDQLNILAA